MPNFPLGIQFLLSRLRFLYGPYALQFPFFYFHSRRGCCVFLLAICSEQRPLTVINGVVWLIAPKGCVEKKCFILEGDVPLYLDSGFPCLQTNLLKLPRNPLLVSVLLLLLLIRLRGYAIGVLAPRSNSWVSTTVLANTNKNPRAWILLTPISLKIIPDVLNRPVV